MIPILFIVTFLAGGVLGAFTVLVSGIRAEERRRRMAVASTGRVELAVRQVMGVYVRKPVAASDTDQARK